MIILDGEADRQAKLDSFSGPTIRHPERATTRSFSPLPDYDTSEAQHRSFTKPPSTHIFDSKFWRAALYALVVYIILSAVIGIPLVVLKSKDKDDKWPLGPTGSQWTVNPPPPLQLFGSGNMMIGENATCNQWNVLPQNASSSLFTATSQFQLDPTALITIRSNISDGTDQTDGLTGSLLVDVNSNSKAGEVLFKLELQSSSLDLRQRTMVCFSDSGDSRGLSIYIPSNLTNQDVLSFNIHVLLPQTSSSTIDNFVTYLPLFSQSFGDFREHGNFNQINIEGASQNISCQFMRASQISVKNTLAPIEGTFNVTDTLTLDTIKGSIDANITLIQLPTCPKPTLLNLDTGLSGINARVTLLAPLGNSSQSQAPPAFVVQVKTFSGPVNLDITHDKLTPSSAVQVQVQNNMAQSTITLDAKFQGTFNLLTKLGQISILDFLRSQRDDPTGGNRNRTLVYDQIDVNKALGWVGWGPRVSGAMQGYLDVASSFSPITLNFGS
ncbi:hypothetical protein K443DRAFT_671220 [Laccaria amethystina LaAM-08-1]|uniref:Uncharacterized protein n=1 Tax=Laccaria amethystina LaAM-08-1 TaxID=1095629 RepID=A0A0C9XY64_9AGAR|nr:hypothetical protein K443DRAFT_671220 [Laccaria amethystina LaAM-08-1]